jgi:transcription elongation GreA/GreB family factor
MALMRRKAGESVVVDTPEGAIHYDIIKVEHSVA